MSKLVSVCMIVKNEEDVLPRCLDAIRGLWDELIIVDTGSTDRTVDIAKEYGAKVLHYEWVYPGHKGEARNLGIDAATGNWIVVVDADEVVCEPLKLRAILAESSTVDTLQVRFDNYVNGQVTLSWRQVRIFQRGAYRYKYREHEIPVATKGTVIGQTDIIFEHRTPENRAGTKSDAMLARLAADVSENPNDPHPLYFYHRECLNQGHNEKAIKLGQKYLELTKNGGYIQADIHGNMAIAYQRIGYTNKARESLHLAAACEPYNREWLYRLGALHVDCQEWNIALAMLRAATEIYPGGGKQWNPQTTSRIYQLIEQCQHEIAHAMAHSHTH